MFDMNSKYDSMGFETRQVHAGCEPEQVFGSVVPPIDMSTTYIQTAPGVPASCFDYSRCGNPTILALERNLASLEKAKYALATNTGMAAVVTILGILKSG
jgi:cystathionine beta-lyase/cystathionine gamma-synthase